MSLEEFDEGKIVSSPYLFFTGKGGVGKTSVSCAVALSLADAGKKVLLVSTDPASNLQDVFEMDIAEGGTVVADCPNLTVMDVDPQRAAAAYREAVVGPYRGVLPDAAVRNIEEQLSGSCTVEIAAFDEFARLLTDPVIAATYDHVIFDTAPTGHTLRMLALPSAWTSYLDENTTGTSCLGQLSGLGDKREDYARAVSTLSDKTMTTLILVARPQRPTLAEAERSSAELFALGIENQLLIVNGILEETGDELSEEMRVSQHDALAAMPERLSHLATFSLPLKPFNVTGLGYLRTFLGKGDPTPEAVAVDHPGAHSLQDLVDDLYTTGKRVIFTMGKGGVGKTTLAVALAKGLAAKGAKVRLTTTDPADHLAFFAAQLDGVAVSHIDEDRELERYKEEVLSKAREVMGEEDLAYVEEDLRSPCTQEIAVFRAFAEIVGKADGEVVVIDTAPTGHTLLLLDSTQSYGTQIEHTGGEVPESVARLLPRLRDADETDVIIVTLPEATPVFEAERLREDLLRVPIENRWWVVNQSLSMSDVKSPILRARAASEKQWFDRVNRVSKGMTVGIPWLADKGRVDEGEHEDAALQASRYDRGIQERRGRES